MLPNYYIIKKFFLGILFLGFQQLFAADVATAAIQDDSSLRLAIKDSWLTESPAKVIKNKTFTQNLPGGGPVQIRVGARGNELMVILARERNGAYTGWAQGSWIYSRNYTTGSPERIRIFLRSDPMAYVQFRPLGKDKSFMDVVLYEAYVVRGLPIGIPLDRLLTIPVEEALAAAGDRFPRRYFDPDPRMYRNIRTFAGKVRSILPSLNFADDGAIDENGSYVFIENLQSQADPVGLNCSGFAKWIVDGLLRPITGKRLTVTALKAPVTQRTSSLAANFENRDSLFGLDWTRNLALEAARVLKSPGEPLKGTFATVENVEVRQETFAALIDRTRGSAAVKSYPGFLLNAGFSVEGLRPLLYTLAINEPGNLYLASVNRERGPAPVQRQHYHVAVLVPYFNEYGVFQVAVFESAAETNLAGFIGRHPGAQINLVRIPVEGIFDP
jgi:hypothetical protein